MQGKTDSFYGSQTRQINQQKKTIKNNNIEFKIVSLLFYLFICAYSQSHSISISDFGKLIGGRGFNNYCALYCSDSDY